MFQTGNIVTVGNNLYIVKETPTHIIELISAVSSNCIAGFRFKQIGDIYVAGTGMREEIDPDIYDEIGRWIPFDEMEDSDLLRNDYRVTFIARSMKDYITQRALRSFEELR